MSDLAVDSGFYHIGAGRKLLAYEVVASLQQHGFQAYLVGGCVRDRLLGIEPKDYDVGTDATPVQVQALFPDAGIVGAHFGVMLVRQAAEIHVEVATFRSEGEYLDGRHPQAVQFEGDPSRDACRRDFTINGLFEDPVSGRVLDFVDGLADLHAKVIRAIGDPVSRFSEDHLRLLRAVRFAARLRFEIHPDTMRAMQQLAPAIRDVSVERIREELVRILTEGGARYGLELLSQSGLLAEILPEVQALQGVQQPPQFHPEGDVWTHVLLMLEAMDHPSRTLAWGVLLHDIGKPPTFRVADRIRFDGHAELGASMAEQLLLRLKAPGSDIEQVVSLVANHMRFKDVLQMRLSTLKRFLRFPYFSEHLELHRLDCAASNGYTQAYEFVRQALDTLAQEQLSPPRLITGSDLVKVGYAPGPAFKQALHAVETAQLEGEISTREQALELARTHLMGNIGN